MSASARGTIEEPGRNVRAKSGLNKAILDQGWFEFRRQLDYKLFWKGGMACSQANHRSGRQQNPFRARASKPVGNREEVLPVAS